ncbi:MAG: tRNA dihydrouridine synthase DusB [Elusimicrobia bacterium]|nr:tRNA dihydrouridine synthase DusB [Elusimicrobiota bacterium]
MPAALTIGPLSLASRVLQSPMADCTDLPFRLIAREHGLTLACVEMVSANSLARANRKTLEMLKTIPQDRPLAVQLLGSDPATMARAAAAVEGMGADLLDINLGCSVRKVVKNGEGAALLREPGKVGRILRAVRRALKRLPLTVKMRKGFDDESGRQAVEIAAISELEGVSALAVHGRTALQGYDVKADYAAIGAVKAAVRIPVIGNGDVFSAEDALAMAAASSCDAVMVGRGGLGNPWIYRDIDLALAGGGPKAAPPNPAERRAVLLRHLDYEALHVGERLAALNMRRIGAWYTTGLPHAKRLRTALCLADSTAAARRLIEEFFDRLGIQGPAHGLAQ